VKKVRYIAGAAGLVPVAAAFMAPAAAHAATHAASADSGKPTKVVTVIGSGATNAKCTGTIEGHAHNNHESITFWYTKSGCIGTVETVTYAGIAASPANPQIHIYGNGKLEWTGTLVYTSTSSPAYISSNRTQYWSVHAKFANPVGVYGKAPTLFGGYGGQLGPAGLNVN
jgi:hypothetical protein